MHQYSVFSGDHKDNLFNEVFLPSMYGDQVVSMYYYQNNDTTEHFPPEHTNKLNSLIPEYMLYVIGIICIYIYIYIYANQALI